MKFSINTNFLFFAFVLCKSFFNFLNIQFNLYIVSFNLGYLAITQSQALKCYTCDLCSGVPNATEVCGASTSSQSNSTWSCQVKI